MTERGFVCIQAMALDLAARELRRVHARVQAVGLGRFATEIASVAIEAERLIDRFDQALDAVIAQGQEGSA